MSYATYTTEAIVCGTFERGSANKSILLFTKDAGMLFADARSVREERSRQRYALQDFSTIRVSLVKGKAGWRVGSVESLGNAFLGNDDRGKRAALVGLVRLLRRYIQGEEPVPAVYELVRQALAAVGESELAHLSNFSLLLELQILAALGYVSRTSELTPYLDQAVATLDQSLSEAEISRIRLVLDEASAVSHL